MSVTQLPADLLPCEKLAEFLSRVLESFAADGAVEGGSSGETSDEGWLTPEEEARGGSAAAAAAAARSSKDPEQTHTPSLCWMRF